MLKENRVVLDEVEVWIPENGRNAKKVALRDNLAVLAEQVHKGVDGRAGRAHERSDVELNVDTVILPVDCFSGDIDSEQAKLRNSIAEQNREFEFDSPNRFAFNEDVSRGSSRQCVRQ